MDLRSSRLLGKFLVELNDGFVQTQLCTLWGVHSVHILFCFPSQVLVSNWAAVAAQQMVEHVKNALQSLPSPRTPTFGGVVFQICGQGREGTAL